MGKDAYSSIAARFSGSCIVKDLEEWISLTRDKYKLGEEEELFHLPGRSRMTGQALGEVIKLTAVSLGLDSSRVSAVWRGDDDGRCGAPSIRTCVLGRVVRDVQLSKALFGTGD
jgi:hypothetical protein